MLGLFVLTSFLSAALLFAVEPMLGRFVLPLLGGSPAVWNTCVVFFQIVLLAGYGYTHLTTRRLRPRAQALVHALVVLAAFVSLPLALPNGTTPPVTDLPAVWLLGLLATTAGLPFFAVATTAPLLQHWFSHTRHPRARDPYFLYAAGNLGSVIGLLAYPLLIEPALALRAQGVAWTVAFAGLTLGLAGCAAFMLRDVRGGGAGKPVPSGAGKRGNSAAPPSWSRRLLWLVLAAVPSSLTLGVTQYISTDLTAIPLAWIVPLLVYLLTFVAAFSTRVRLPLRALGAALLVVAPGAGVLLALAVHQPVLPLILAHLVALAVAALVCHGRLAATRPHTAHLTGFYLAMALGGVVGGAFNAFAAPLLFDTVLEYPIALVAACLLAPVGGWPQRVDDTARAAARGLRWWRLAAVPVLAAGFALVAQHAVNAEPGVQVLLRSRTFFGVHKVIADRSQWYDLMHGTILHGTQSHQTDPRTGFYWGRMPTAYFHESGPIGDVFRVFGGQPKMARVAVIGLGAGTLAAYAVRGQEFDFFEIDPEVARIASDRRYFTYLGDARARGAKVDVVLGDGRLTLARRVGSPYGLIVLDAFSGDAVPIHLLTREGMLVYRDHLAQGGLIAIHISSQFFDFRPVLAAIARNLGMVVWFRDDSVVSDADRARAKRPSWWVLIARADADLGPLAQDPNWVRLSPSPRVPVWTDDHANLLGVFMPSFLPGRGD